MVGTVELLLATIPLVIAAVLLVGFFWPATRAMPVAWVTALVVGYVVWNMPWEWLAGASIVGVMTALEILWIVFGALVLLYTLMQTGAFDRINAGFAAVSDDRRVQIILLAFFMATFIEGAAGFGTPAAVVAPLLLALGFPALAAVIAALIGHIIAVTYGAVGTPIIVGVESPLGDVDTTREAIQAEGIEVADFAIEVAAWAATYHAIAGFIMPLFAVGMIVYFFGEERSIKPALEVAPLCLFAGIAFAIPYWASAWFLTAEFPALIGAMVGGAIVVGALRAGYFRPEDEWDFPAREEWPDHWVGTIEPGQSNDSADETLDMPILKAWAPYIVLIALLIVTRIWEPAADFITQSVFTIQYENILGTGLDESIEWMNVPGFWLILSALIAIPLYGMSTDDVKAAWSKAGRKIAAPFIALIFVIAMVQVMLQSGGHEAALQMIVEDEETSVSMIEALAITTADIAGDGYPFIAPLIGALGAAMAGSATVSNITFSNFQFVSADQLDLPKQIIVGAQAVGGAIGNLVAIHNVVAALATVGLVGQEGRVMRLNLIPLVYYAVVTGVLALLFSYVFFPDVF
ncbi:L-lactate permease [Salinarchaeum sp. IM2453]|uniref:L-lactate permease n=1 Tax=Salinarchaeum sp. IM2453 TaxID=2862870 RepID=UPI001C83FECC|nr:L-lactate permease [Salinarchaeum sp. IM2453]QZA88248.1 L-lactate permease [Salinarchaeum sp. IM2453]